MSRQSKYDQAVYEVDRNYGSRLELLEIDSVYPNPYQPRKIFTEESLTELTASLKSYGQLQPITVRKVGGKYELIAGERRWRAAKRAGFTHIKAIVAHAVETDSAMIALIENLQRENLHFIEEAEAYLNLMRDHGLTQEELASRLGKNQSTIANKLRILKLPRRVKEMIIAGKLTERHSRALLRLHDEETQVRLIRQICENQLSVKLTEELVEHTLKTMYSEDANPAHRRVFFLMRDCKLCINSIRKTIDKLTASGASIKFETRDVSDSIIMEIVIAKPKEAVQTPAAKRA